MGQMLANANLVITAWEGDTLVGIARSVTDFCYTTYLADLAVRIDMKSHNSGYSLDRSLFYQLQCAVASLLRRLKYASPAHWQVSGSMQGHRCSQQNCGMSIVAASGVIRLTL